MKKKLNVRIAEKKVIQIDFAKNKKNLTKIQKDKENIQDLEVNLPKKKILLLKNKMKTVKKLFPHYNKKQKLWFHERLKLFLIEFIIFWNKFKF